MSCSAHCFWLIASAVRIRNQRSPSCSALCNVSTLYTFLVVFMWKPMSSRNWIRIKLFFKKKITNNAFIEWNLLMIRKYSVYNVLCFLCEFLLTLQYDRWSYAQLGNDLVAFACDYNDITQVLFNEQNHNDDMTGDMHASVAVTSHSQVLYANSSIYA